MPEGHRLFFTGQNEADESHTHIQEDLPQREAVSSLKKALDGLSLSLNQVKVSGEEEARRLERVEHELHQQVFPFCLQIMYASLQKDELTVT